MFFRSRYIVRHFGLHETPDALEIEKGSPPPIKISLHPIKKEEIKQFYEEDDWVALLSTEEVVSEKIAAQFENNEKEPTQAVREVSTRISSRIHSFLTEFLRVVRWRNGVTGHHQLIRCAEGELEWSQDEVTWKPAGRLITASVTVELLAVRFKSSLFDEINEMLLAEDYEPVGHELLREAWNLRHDSPRSALILGVSALEVGVKSFIAKLVPASEWLCFEMPAPPVVKLLEEYLPKLPVKLKINDKVFIPQKIIEALKKAVLKRNGVAHKGTMIHGGESLANILTNIQMTLYFLDYYAGHVWAINNVRDSDINL
jgi:hypothetical protein